MYPLQLFIMKNIILYLILAFSSVYCSAQFSNNWLGKENKHLLYSNMDLMVGNKSGGKLGMSFVYNSKYSVELGYSALSNQISYIPILKSANNSENSETLVPDEMMDNFNIMVGRHFNLNQKKTIRFVLQGGPGISVIREAFNHKSSDFNTYEPVITNKTNDFSIILNSKFEFPIVNLLGFSAGPSLVMNQEKSYLTFCVGIMYGILNTK